MQRVASFKIQKISKIQLKQQIMPTISIRGSLRSLEKAKLTENLVCNKVSMQFLSLIKYRNFGIDERKSSSDKSTHEAKQIAAK